MKTAIVLTTISIPGVLEEYVKNFRLYGQRDVVFIVAGDLKTPEGMSDFAARTSSDGFECVYLGPKDQ